MGWYDGDENPKESIDTKLYAIQTQEKKIVPAIIVQRPQKVGNPDVLAYLVSFHKDGKNQFMIQKTYKNTDEMPNEKKLTDIRLTQYNLSVPYLGEFGPGIGTRLETYYKREFNKLGISLEQKTKTC